MLCERNQTKKIRHFKSYLIITLMLKFSLALVSMNITPCSLPFSSPSLIDTCLFFITQNKEEACYDLKISLEIWFFFLYVFYLLSTRSVLLPTRTIITSPEPPLSLCTSSIHFGIFRNVCLSAKRVIKTRKW